MNLVKPSCRDCILGKRAEHDILREVLLTCFCLLWSPDWNIQWGPVSLAIDEQQMVTYLNTKYAFIQYKTQFSFNLLWLQKASIRRFQ